MGNLLRYFFLIFIIFFSMRFTQKGQSTKVESGMALKDTMASLLHLALDQFCVQPGRGPLWGLEEAQADRGWYLSRISRSVTAVTSACLCSKSL